ncbi:class I SAM-dependent DNA methyltransferase [Pseudomonas granadensis]|uniref:class I SAM-dependent DNA methyltransferase n=1 Tax=Pseudomonas granadensis TaxID=1421430 RepID=UPI0019D1FEBF|nr:DNA methyltransferase [Pseudomonas granadensis]MBN6774526.1 class I SAM-dependent DNA methyltransferase [Pseudomonas granadensis]MBN6805674.1 class I SAM-dependent DNA methyltransferase [Pseudomonas granadensis]MBN6832552.1 class I SAM-dependent DNA methyltransferase [Pseudomonas granadensis]MBN6839868.1 class I SAM-dependent DNA methyltransferase [Pseudomonas granadensis]MBN6869243.1 class I SAM-dependent DNA methyltransferase [Pseudomonas granadensis]
MNAVEIESAISELALQPFDAAEFPFAFLAAFGSKDTALKRLRAGNNNTSDVPGGVLLRSNIHIAVCKAGTVGETLKALRASPATTKSKAKFILATDGQTLEAEQLASGETITCAYPDFPNRFGFFLPLAGISTIKEIKDNPIDVRATGRLNKLYVELLSENPDWAKAERRHDMNHFMARLIFCFFAEDTDIFDGEGLFTQTVEQMSERDGSDTHEVLEAIFRSMNIKVAERGNAEPRLPNWIKGFPYVNGGLFSGSTDVPRFTRMARTYLMHAGNLNWKQINPDIFGSMIQAVADDEERSALGMHYTSVPNILKVLNPLFLDDLRAQLNEAGDNDRKLLNLRKRMARIRVFDPACGSGNFLVIAYKQMREIEAEVNRRRGEPHLGSEIPLTNFRGIELRDFPAEIARLALIIAEFQCDVLYRGQKDALAEFLPLDAQNWIVCHDALQLDWLSVCPPTGTGVKLVADDLFGAPLNQAEIDFENEGGETYICGNPPYAGLSSQTNKQKDDLQSLFVGKTTYWKSFDYVMAWFWKANEFMRGQTAKAAFVSTNSICQGQLVSMFWPMILRDGARIFFAHTSFKWNNLAANNAGVTVAIIGLSNSEEKTIRLFSTQNSGEVSQKVVPNVNAYLVAGPDIYVDAESKPLFDLPVMFWGNKPVDGGHLLMTKDEARDLIRAEPEALPYLRPFYGSVEFISGKSRTCLWVDDSEVEQANQFASLRARFEQVREFRLSSKAKETRPSSKYPHRFRQIQGSPGNESIVVPIHSSESRQYLPVGLLPKGAIVSNAAFAIYDVSQVCLALLASRLHLVWIATVCGKIKTDYRYSNTLGWNTFPVPLLTEQNKADLTACAEGILLAREAHFPATIADLYDPDNMPDNLRRAHERNDEVLERIYIGRRFRNDTERLEKLFDLYTKMTADTAKAIPKKTRGKMA